MVKTNAKWLIIALVALLVLTIPWTMSMFAGQHSFHEVNDVKTGCSKCHEDIWQELEISPTIAVHKNAASNTNYTTYMFVGGISFNKTAFENMDGVLTYYPVIYSIDFAEITIGDNSSYASGDVAYFWNDSFGWEKATWNTTLPKRFDPSDEFYNISIDIDEIPGITTDEVCHLCHNISLFGLSGTHTKMIVRVCDDDRCHGNWNHTYNDPDLFDDSSIKLTHVGSNLSSSIHASFYLTASNESTAYAAGSPFGHKAGNEYNSYISKGYWSCLGCHSDAQTDIEIIPAGLYNHSDPDAERQRYR